MARGAFGVLVVLVLAGTAAAGNSGRPRLGDHDFVPVTELVEPFLASHVQSTVSLGQTRDAVVPVFSVTDSTILGTAPADLVIAGLGFAYQHNVKDWLAVRADLFAAGRVGTSTTTLLAEGFTGAVGYRFAWLMRIHRSHSLQISGSVSLGTNDAAFVNLLHWANGLLAGRPTPLARSRNSLSGSGGVHAAWGLSRRFGLLGTYQLAYGESFDGLGDNEWNHDGRLALSYDAKYDVRMPLGLVLASGRFERNEGSSASPGIWFWSLRLAAQGREDFSLGLTYKNLYAESSRTGKDLQFSQIVIDMRYFY